jgi:CubicO group peptidase (beta-lactamase class C family)
VLACAGAKPYPELLSASLWSAIGAERDAEIILDSDGFPLVEGGMCATLRDVARFGLMWLQGGSLDGRTIVPGDWIARLLVREQELIDAYGDHNELGGPTPEAFYHDNWWVWDAERGVHAAVGMNGQCIFVHRASRTVIAKLSTFPDAIDPDRYELQHAGMSALCESLAAVEDR